MTAGEHEREAARFLAFYRARGQAVDEAWPVWAASKWFQSGDADAIYRIVRAELLATTECTATDLDEWRRRRVARSRKERT